MVHEVPYILSNVLEVLKLARNVTESYSATCVAIVISLLWDLSIYIILLYQKY